MCESVNILHALDEYSQLHTCKLKPAVCVRLSFVMRVSCSCVVFGVLLQMISSNIHSSHLLLMRVSQAYDEDLSLCLPCKGMIVVRLIVSSMLRHC